MSIRTVDLFCGAGGSSWGARAAGSEIVRGVDAWDTAAKTYARNFGVGRSLLHTMKPNTGADILGDVGSIDLLLASPECTNHTCAKGNKPRCEKSKGTANYVIRFARELEPRWIVVENVIHMRGWEGYSNLIRRLERLGYIVRPEILDAQDFGVPQSRKRLFLLCDRKRMPRKVLPIAGPPLPAASIIQPGRWESRELGRRALPTIERANRAIQVLGEGVPFIVVYYGTDGSGGWQPLTRPLRTMTTLDRFGLVTWDGPTPLLRMLQVPELQMAMGFEEAFVLDEGSRRDKVKLLGNGVCPPVMKAIVKSLTDY